MAGEIDITFPKGGVRSLGTDKMEVTFTVHHNADDVDIAEDEIVKGPANQNELWNAVKYRARAIYAEYEQQKVWLGYTLPKTMTISAKE